MTISMIIIVLWLSNIYDIIGFPPRALLIDPLRRPLFQFCQHRELKLDPIKILAAVNMSSRPRTRSQPHDSRTRSRARDDDQSRAVGTEAGVIRVQLQGSGRKPKREEETGDVQSCGATDPPRSGSDDVGDEWDIVDEKVTFKHGYSQAPFSYRPMTFIAHTQTQKGVVRNIKWGGLPPPACRHL